MFSTLRPGSQVFLLEKNGQSPVLKIGQVEQVTPPQPKYQTFTPGATIGLPNMNDTVMNIRIKFDDGPRDYNQIPTNLSVADFGNGTVLIDNKADAIQEVEVMMQASRQALASRVYHENVLQAGEQMLKQLNPSFAKEAERDKAIDSLKQDVKTLTDSMAQFFQYMATQVAGNNGGDMRSSPIPNQQ